MNPNELSAAAQKALAFEEKKLPSGLVLRVAPMPQYGTTHAIYSTHFGSINRGFSLEGAEYLLPAGTAHFLEHKMFESEDGVDAFTLYARTGASANAYTSFDRTSYIFTAPDKLPQNLDILLGLVGKPYFTPENVHKEQGIIGQEIKMYDDDADWRLMFALLESLYHNHPVRDDIAGSVESISMITPELLYRCCEAFYGPANMVLAAAGNVTMAELEEAAERAGLAAAKPVTAGRVFPQEPDSVARAEHTFSMPVALPILGLGFKETPVPRAEMPRMQVICDMLTELLCGETSALYRRLYDEGLVQPEFGAEFGMYDDALHFMVQAETPDPQAVRRAVLEEIDRQRREGIDVEQFTACKNMMVGDAISARQNVSQAASGLVSTYFCETTPEEMLRHVAELTPVDVQDALGLMLQEQSSATVIIRPLEQN